MTHDMTESQDKIMQEDTSWRVVEQRLYDRDCPDDLTTAVIEAVADAEDVDLLDVKEPPLYEIVDIGAIEDCFFGPNEGEERGNSVGSVDFEYRGLRVTVRSDGWVQVAEATAQP